MTAFVDANIILRFLRDDVPTQSPSCKELFLTVERGEQAVWTSELVISEVVFVLSRLYKEPREAIARAVLGLLEFKQLKVPHKSMYRRVFYLYTTLNLSYVDCHSAVLVENHPQKEMFSYDRGLSRVSTITRREPAASE